MILLGIGREQIQSYTNAWIDFQTPFIGGCQLLSLAKRLWFEKLQEFPQGIWLIIGYGQACDWHSFISFSFRKFIKMDFCTESIPKNKCSFHWKAMKNCNLNSQSLPSYSKTCLKLLTFQIHPLSRADMNK